MSEDFKDFLAVILLLFFPLFIIITPIVLLGHWLRKNKIVDL